MTAQDGKIRVGKEMARRIERALKLTNFRAKVDENASAWHTFVAPLGRSLAVERLTLDQVGGVRIPAPQPLLLIDIASKTRGREYRNPGHNRVNTATNTTTGVRLCRTHTTAARKTRESPGSARTGTGV